MSSDLWVEKYAPNSLNDLVGNKGVIDSLYEWLKDWDDVIFKGLKKQVFCQRGKSYQDLPRVNARACMLSGPPGIGKSSAARMIAKELGFSVLSLNASDNRSKKMIESLLKDTSTSSSIVRYGESNAAFKNRSVIIMDEVDGVSSNDRGGIQALICIIRKTKVPIICIANDSRHKKL